MKVTIENYRGFDIEFDTDCEKFQCIVTEENTKESKSFSVVKKFVDEYNKTNQNFKPFYVETIPDKYARNKKLKVIGLRKDDRFIAEKENGERIQIRDYDLSDYMLLKVSNKERMQLLGDLDAEYETNRKKYVASKKDIIDKIEVTTLRDYKKTIIG